MCRSLTGPIFASRASGRDRGYVGAADPRIPCGSAAPSPVGAGPLPTSYGPLRPTDVVSGRVAGSPLRTPAKPGY